ncbi:MAG: methyltransferase domain-containing protein [Burkholderiaceae bacterium]|nr:methyltransferase domain-containing protein [Burkholderiaceae bacterium]
MTGQTFDNAYGGTPAENYERYFVPHIAAPLAEHLLETAALRPGERILDVACGTGVVARLARQRVGEGGAAAGLDPHPGMLAVARSAASPKLAIDWYEAGAEAMPLAEGAFDVVLCQLGLQFIANKLGALREMRRVLAPDGRLALNVPGPTPPLFAVMADALGRHVDPRAASFVHIVFSLHDERELRELVNAAGFQDIRVETRHATLAVPPSNRFLWHYVFSTPLTNLVAQASEETRTALESEVVEKWRDFEVDGRLRFEVPVTTVVAR